VTVTRASKAPSNPDAPHPVVEVENLSVRRKSARGTVTLVDGISFSVMPGRAVALVGESGAGKSLSCRAILDLLNRRKFEVSGSVRLDGIEVDRLGAKKRRMVTSRTASLVFQDPTRSLNPTMQVGWQVAEALYKSRARDGISKDEAKARAVELMSQLGIADPEERFFAYPHQLSGGMRQRIVIAIALSCEPKVIFADEPTTSLDVTTQAQIMDLLEQLRRELNIAVVLVTHDLALAASRVDEAMVMYAGRLVEKLPTAEVSLRASMPYSQALLRAVPGLGVNGELPVPIPGAPPDPAHLPGGCSFHPRCDRVADVCRLEQPELRTLEVDHECACWFPVEMGDVKTTAPSSVELSK
jgi:oligopeptide/dipeptide ABC transporter ATP-binding protein